MPHYLTASGYFRAPWGINVGGILTLALRLPLYRCGRHRRRRRRRDRRTRSATGRRRSTRNSFRYPNQTTLDLSASKQFTLTGSNRIELRAEVFNATNTKAVTGVNNTIGLDVNNPPATFGQVTNRLGAIEGQVSIRYRF